MKNTLIFLAKRNRAGQIITAVPKKVTAKFAEFALKRNNVNKGGKWGTKEDFHQFNFEEKPKVEPTRVVPEEKPARKRRLKKAETPAPDKIEAPAPDNAEAPTTDEQTK